MDTPQNTQPQFNTFQQMPEEAAKETVELINTLDDSIFHARKPERRAKLMTRRDELITDLEKKGVVTETRSGHLILVPTKEENDRIAEQLAHFHQEQLVRTLNGKRQELLVRIDAAIRDLGEMRDSFVMGHNETWMLSSSNFTDVTRLAIEVKLLTDTLTKLDILA